MNFSKITNKGIVRKNNEDYIFATNKKINKLDNLFIVCDGVGGNACGEVASKNSIKSFVKCLKQNEIVSMLDSGRVKTIFQYGISFAEKTLRDISSKKEKTKGMCTTFVCATICNNKLYVTNIGDSRLYLISQSKKQDGENIVYDRVIDQITVDNAQIIEQRVVPKDVALDINCDSLQSINTINRKYLTKSLGYTPNVVGDFYEVDLSKKIENKNEIYILMCTDGLYGNITNENIKNILFNNKFKLKDKTKHLVKMALDAGGNDNISAILIEV